MISSIFLFDFDSKVLDLVKQKGFYPYEYMSGFKKFKEELLSKEKFCSSLTGTKYSGGEYEDVLEVWDRLEMKTMKDCYDLYWKCDFLLLADVSEKFGNSSLKIMGNTRSHYLSAQALCWDAMLNKTKVMNLFQMLVFILFKRCERWSFLNFQET